ncbi:aldehyde oxidase and xanthine dehydrogenase, molybdopterin binding domain protein [Oesophagostomum dentatum]|uniref:Aldehyde oxidase and xanthine dehydrogenase, molybdopterin binding domain protein n=1 Tax=Oesophagostomum dentatum TaxID=61180 RepID=A0A0B1TN99_OESDE|nr:aldehyde oxidase and xanthine dehydrogenase, molybdopterin binding domain protein [Oesophagostomum dentatum]
MVQLHTSAVLGIPAHKVIVRIKRVGGAFGGKCTQSLPIASSAVIAANALKRPVSVVLSRREDMLITGKRHPAMVKYRVGVDPNGLLQSAYLKVYIDGGCARDCSGLVTFLSASSADTCLNIPVLRTEGYTLKTNTTSHTAFRGFGVPQAYYAMDCILEHVGHTVGKPVEQVRQMNFNLAGGKALLGYKILNDNLLDCWNECLKLSGFYKQRDEINEFNKNSKYVKRGIALGTTRMGLTHAGPCEQLPINMITIIESGTDKTCNAPETGGSQNADIHGKAIQACCEKLLQGLRPVLKEEPDWKKAVMKAFQMRIPLQASEHIRIDREKYGIEEEAPTYHTTGAVCVLSETDCRTGEHKLLSVDLVMDVGHSLNPAIDIGQIEGAFMQGYGLMTCEELTYDDDGKLVQDSLYKYKLPTAAMTPRRYI